MFYIINFLIFQSLTMVFCIYIFWISEFSVWFLLPVTLIISYRVSISENFLVVVLNLLWSWRWTNSILNYKVYGFWIWWIWTLTDLCSIVAMEISDVSLFNGWAVKPNHWTYCIFLSAFKILFFAYVCFFYVS
jgi:hypothetical protein